MRFFTTALALAGLAGYAAAHVGGYSRRKSLGFGPVHPHAKFHSGVPIVTNNFLTTDNPYEVARSFLSELLGSQLSSENGFFIRDDSYTDDATGVTHIYVRQLISGVEVVDGDINLNIKDGLVLSYGDSFYRGVAPASIEFEPSGRHVNVHAEHCESLYEEFQGRRNFLMNLHANSDQDILVRADETILSPIQHLYESNCAHVETPYKMLDHSLSHNSHPFDSRHALLQFMIAATPKAEVVEDIAARYSEHLERMTSTFEQHLVGDRMTLTEVINNVPDAVSPVKVRPAYIQVPDGEKTSLMMVWRFEVEMQDNWYEASVSVKAPHRILSVVDWASDAPHPKVPEQHPPATYRVFRWGINDPEWGDRTLEKESFDSLASPLGWHVLPAENDPMVTGAKKGEFSNTTITRGNNVFAHENWDGRNDWLYNYRPDAGESMIFDYPYNPTESDDNMSEAKKHINATITQLFYTTNLVHDLYYRYGFDEKAGNFQQHNFGRGGRGNDAVIANAQDGSGFNNANFMTPPDGQNGRCRMYLWNTATPYRDGDLEAGIVIHELSHGLSTRLTGGPANSGCLGWGESGGMGEGWGDFLATMIRSNKTYSDYPMGAWAANNPGGIRKYPYSLDTTINPSTYKTLDSPGYWGVHAIGEVWAEMLWHVAHRLIKKHGFSDTLYPPMPLEAGTIPTGEFYHEAERDSAGRLRPLVPRHGNSLIVQLVLDGMKIQQCRPSFMDARDAIIEADAVRTGGANFCDLWLGFAELGLGMDARVDGRTPWGGGIRTNGYKVPDSCGNSDEPTNPDPEEPGDEDDLWF